MSPRRGKGKRPPTEKSLSGLDPEGKSLTLSLKSLSSEEVARLAMLSQVSQALNSSSRLNPVLKSVLEAVMTCFEADRGLVRLHNPEALEIAIDQSVQPPAEHFRFTTTLLDQCLDEGRSILVLDSTEVVPSESMKISGIRSVMIAPLLLDGRVLGALYIDSLMQAGRFQKPDLELLGVIAEM